MKKKSLALVSAIILIAISVTLILTSCVTGKYYTLDEKGKFVKNGPSLFLTNSTFEYKDKLDGKDYVLSGTMKKTAEEIYKHDGKEYKAQIYDVNIKKIKLMGTTYSVKDGKWIDENKNEANFLASLSLSAIKEANSKLAFDQKDGIAWVGLKVLFKKELKK